MAFLVAAATFMIAIVVLAAIWLSLGRNSPQRAINQRIVAVRKNDAPGEISGDFTLVRDETFSSVPALNRILMRLAWSKGLRDFIAQAGMKIRPAKLLLWCGVLGMSAYMVVAQVLHLSFFGLLAGVGAAAIPLAFVALKRRRRLRKFEELFPEALDLLSRAVRAGHAFTTGLEMIAKESPALLATEFRKTFDEQNFGLPIRDALVRLSERIPLVDVRFFVTALLVQKETGGNLAGILDELARLIRERFRIHREVQVKTAQGRLTAAILIAMPVGMLIALEIANPKYVNVLFTDPRGPSLLAAAVALQIFGALILWKIIHIEV